MNKRAIIKVFGLVQGVNFRYYTKRKAEDLGVVGWVKNEADGSVTVVAEGDEENLKELIEWVKKGPPLASVKKVRIEWKMPKGEKGFEVRFDGE
jgi:acylphosphatase